MRTQIALSIATCLLIPTLSFAEDKVTFSNNTTSCIIISSIEGPNFVKYLNPSQQDYSFSVDSNVYDLGVCVGHTGSDCASSNPLGFGNCIHTSVTIKVKDKASWAVNTSSSDAKISVTEQ